MNAESRRARGRPGEPGGPQRSGPPSLRRAVHGGDTEAMFARYFVEMPLDPERVEDALLRDPHSWLPSLAGEANFRGDELMAEVGFGDDVRVARRVTIDIGRPITMPSKTVVPIRWTATGASGLFPSLDADLEIAPLGPHRTQLAMSARYVPPLGAVGRAIDRAVLFRIAEATLKDFLDRVAASVLDDHGTTRPA
jgi:hypothetical protein